MPKFILKKLLILSMLFTLVLIGSAGCASTVSTPPVSEDETAAEVTADKEIQETQKTDKIDETEVSSDNMQNLKDTPAKLPPQLKTSGNKIVLADDETKTVWLTGVNLGGSDWSRSLDGENIPMQIDEIIANWNVNVVRVPVSLRGWHGAIRWWESDTGNSEGYRQDIKDIVKKFNDAGIYVIIDLHEFNYPTDKYSYFDSGHDYTDGVPLEFPGVIDFWTTVASDEFYANNPGVLFGIFNEYTYQTSDKTKSWDIWRNGGLSDKGEIITGHQEIVETIRCLGAKNIIIAGGLDWAYDLTGIAGVGTKDNVSFALDDKSSDGDLNKTGYGIVYDAHIYPWKGSASNWDKSVGEVRKIYPVLIGECGYDPDDGTQKNNASQWTLAKSEKWCTMFFDWVNDKDNKYGGVPASWTGWCFHTAASPRILADWDFTPTEFWGVYVKEQLAARDYF